MNTDSPVKQTGNPVAQVLQAESEAESILKAAADQAKTIVARAQDEVRQALESAEAKKKTEVFEMINKSKEESQARYRRLHEEGRGRVQLMISGAKKQKTAAVQKVVESFTSLFGNT